MLKHLKQKWMAFKDIFKDDNDINEKSVVGFASFAVMVIFAASAIPKLPKVINKNES